MIAEMKEMKLWESYDRGLIHSATRLVVPPMATQSGNAIKLREKRAKYVF